MDGQETEPFPDPEPSLRKEGREEREGAETNPTAVQTNAVGFQSIVSV